MYARKGKKVELPKKDMEILNIKLIEIIDNKNGSFNIKIEINVSSGVYIRSIVEEFGKRLGYPASLLNLRRIKIGDFDIKDAEQIKKVIKS